MYVSFNYITLTSCPGKLRRIQSRPSLSASARHRRLPASARRHRLHCFSTSQSSARLLHFAIVCTILLGLEGLGCPAQVFSHACSSLTVVPAQVSPSCLLKSSHHACSSLPLGMVWSSAYNSHRRHSHASSPHLRPLLTVPKLHSLLACSLMVWSPALTKPSNLNATRRWRSCCPRPRSRRQRTTPARRCATGA